ncbi:hypothetical protein Agub_g7120 [Astrephomene gubernaculifera]|uniref:UTP23 sensor motif region domain-containing protein n=1 Tax=Astrephomene gubernaculifera TaxID=47775 RepID=A0AAD3HM71_9CHLO|nr:hypothetical protein Agub_g7120 [Astrephomene gubernaculifera]
MRRKKHKQTRRATNYYRINYGFHEPYKVLLDGNFIHATKALNLADLASHLPKLLGGACKLYTTKCVTRELRSLGRDFTASADAAHSYPLHKCDHCHSQKEGRDGKDKEEAKEEGGAKGGAKGGSSGCVSAAECIRAAIGSRNEAHWFVATQDAALRQELGKIPGCPLVFATVNGVHLETPSEVTKQKAKEAEAATRSIAPHEAAAQPLLAPEQLAELRRELLLHRQKRQQQGAGGEGAVGVPATSARFRRNKAKGPNPLAVKKRNLKKEAAAAAAAAAAGGKKPAAAAAGGKAGGDKKGREVKGGGGGDDHQQPQKRKRKRGKGAAGEEA